MGYFTKIDRVKNFWYGLGLAHPFDDAFDYKDYGWGNGMELGNEDDSWKGYESGDGCGHADGYYYVEKF